MGTVGAGALMGIAAKVGLAIVLAVGATAAVRSLHLARNRWRPRGGLVNVVETAALGQNRALHLVTVGGRTLLIASTPSEVAMLADVSAECEGEAGEGEIPREGGAGGRGGFGAVLRELIAPRGRGRARGDAAAELRDAADALRSRGGGSA